MTTHVVTIRTINIACFTATEVDLNARKTVRGNARFNVNKLLESLNISNLNNVGGEPAIGCNDALSSDLNALQSQITVGDIWDVCDNRPGDTCGPDDCP